MEKAALLEALRKGSAIEESIVAAVSQIVLFWIDRGFDFGASEEDRTEIKKYLEIIKSDSILHKGALNDIRDVIEKSGSYDF